MRVVCRCLYVVSYLAFVVVLCDDRCMLFVACCLFVVVSCLFVLFAACALALDRCALFEVRRALFVVCYLPVFVGCLLLVACRVLFVVR